MKKLLTLAAVLLLALTLLWGCSDTSADANLYYYLDRGTELTPDANGVYTVNFALGGEKKTFKATDKALLDELKLLDFVGLTLEEDTVVGFTRMVDMPYVRVALDYYVQSLGGSQLKLSGPENYQVLDLLLELPENMPVYDFAPQSTSTGAQTQLQQGDCVSIVSDESGTLLFCYVTDRPSAPQGEKRHCQHCNSEAFWQEWSATDKLPTSSGHYLLTDNVTLTKVASASAGDICLDLNGKTVTQATFGQRIYSLSGSAVLNIMDSVGGGTFIPNSTDGSSGTAVSGLGFYIASFEAVLNLYGGTIDASNTTASYGNGVYMEDGTFNMYGGEILGGSSYGAGGCAVSFKGNFNMYGGKLVGGTSIDASYNLPIGGGTLRVLGVATIYGGEIIGGETDQVGGAIRICGDAFGGAKLILMGGTITGGKAPVGGGIYVSALSELVISGDVKVTGNETGNIYLDPAAKLTYGDEGLGENAEIGLSMAEPGEFLTGVPEGVDISKHIVSDDASKKIVSNGNGSWSMK